MFYKFEYLQIVLGVEKVEVIVSSQNDAVNLAVVLEDSKKVLVWKTDFPISDLGLKDTSLLKLRKIFTPEDYCV